MMLYLLGVLTMTVLGAAASLFLKRASGAVGIEEFLKNSNLYVGGFLYLASAVLNIRILRYLEYSVVLPLTSLTYVWTMFFSYKVLGERISRQKIGGVFLILLGAVCVAV